MSLLIATSVIDVASPPGLTVCVSWAGVSIVAGSTVALLIAYLKCKNTPEEISGADMATMD
jgi:hypothetical protein